MSCDDEPPFTPFGGKPQPFDPSDIDPEADTKPMKLRAGERVQFENRIDLLEREWKTWAAAREKTADTFYATRMVPLEQSNQRASARSAVSMTLGIVAVVIALTALVLHLR